jgi:hypothetical protein
METPAMDASRPSRLRLAGFLLSVLAALAIGLGSLMTWATVGIPQENVNTDIPGVDLTDGKIALACAVILLVCTFLTRVVTGTAAVVFASVAIVASIAALATGGAFLLTGLDRSRVIDSLPPPELWEAVGAFREMGPGALVVMLGGAVGIVGGILSLAWAMRGRDLAAAAPPAGPA